MELILKQPKDKPPCICILFPRIYDASSLNIDWVTSYHNHSFKIIFEISENKLDLILKNEQIGLKHRYKDLVFFSDKFSRFIFDNKKANVFSFCHITAHYDKHIVARIPVAQRNWVLKVESVKVLREM